MESLLFRCGEGRHGRQPVVGRDRVHGGVFHGS
jgi:hypothetical protein